MTEDVETIQSALKDFDFKGNEKHKVIGWVYSKYQEAKEVADTVSKLLEKEQSEKKLNEVQKKQGFNEMDIKNALARIDELEKKIDGVKSDVDSKTKAIEEGISQSKIKEVLENRDKRQIFNTNTVYPALRDYKTVNYDYASKKWVITKAPITEDEKLFSEYFRNLGLGNKSEANAIKKDMDGSAQDYFERAGYKTQISDGAGGLGGNTVYTPIMDEIQALTTSMSMMMSKVEQVSVLQNEFVIPTLSGTMSSYINVQGTTLPEVTLAFLENTVRLDRQGFYIAISNTFLEQRGVNVTPMITKQMASSLHERYDQSLIKGTAVAPSTEASPTAIGGIFQSLTSSTRVLPNTPVTLFNMSPSNLITMDNILSEKVDKMRVCWIGTKRVQNAFSLMQIGDRGIFTELATSKMGAEIYPYGYQFVINEYTGSTYTDNLADFQGGVGAGARTALYLADLSKTYMCMGQEMAIETSRDVNFTQDETVFRVTARYGCKTLDFPATTTNDALDDGVAPRSVNCALEITV
ncbi:MAG: phage major capsid protein [Gammaproteobacteria bacterium]|nr:phage major capsid protein [Gammaproteobacteria bacterium]